MGDNYVYRRPWRRHPRQYRLRGPNYTYEVLRSYAGSYTVTGVDAGYVLSTKFGSRKTRVVGSLNNNGGVFRKPWFRVIRGANYELPSAAILLTAFTGTFSVTGNAALFSVSQASATGSYTLTGNAAAFITKLLSVTGSYAETGNAALASINFVAARGTFSLTGNATTIAFPLVASPAAYVVTCSNVGSSTTMEYWTNQSSGSESWSGQSSTSETWTPQSSTSENWTKT